MIGAAFGFAWIYHNQVQLTDGTCDGTEIPDELCTHAFYLEMEQEDIISFKTYITKMGTWVLLCTNLVPISLLISLEFAKFIQGQFMNWDMTIADEITDDNGNVEEVIYANAQSSNLNEELGQVEYIFSDKTGTLTQNRMNFKKLTIGQNSYGTDEEPTKP